MARPVIMRFSKWEDWEKVWLNRRNLKGKNLFLNEDYCLETRKYRATLLPIMREAKKQGHRAVIIGETLRVDESRYPGVN